MQVLVDEWAKYRFVFCVELTVRLLTCETHYTSRHRYFSVSVVVWFCLHCTLNCSRGISHLSFWRVCDKKLETDKGEETPLMAEGKYWVGFFFSTFKIVFVSLRNVFFLFYYRARVAVFSPNAMLNFQYSSSVTYSPTMKLKVASLCFRELQTQPYVYFWSCNKWKCCTTSC